MSHGHEILSHWGLTWRYLTETVACAHAAAAAACTPEKPQLSLVTWCLSVDVVAADGDGADDVVAAVESALLHAYWLAEPAP